jgi:hypothetical protein
MDAPVLEAVLTATLYFGTFLVVGYGGRWLIDRWMRRRGVHLTEVQDQMGENRRKQTGFLLGVWYRR